MVVVVVVVVVVYEPLVLPYVPVGGGDVCADTIDAATQLTVDKNKHTHARRWERRIIFIVEVSDGRETKLKQDDWTEVTSWKLIPR